MLPLTGRWPLGYRLRDLIFVGDAYDYSSGDTGGLGWAGFVASEIQESSSGDDVGVDAMTDGRGCGAVASGIPGARGARRRKRENPHW